MSLQAYEMDPQGSKNSSYSTVAGYDRDTSLLARMGKKQVLKRTFGFLSMLSFSCTILNTWEGVLVTFSTGFLNGGPAGLVYQYILVWFGNLSTCVCLAELASMAPTAGGQYHWVSMLAPRHMRNFLSYTTGWMLVLGWTACVATGATFTASMIQGLCLANYPSFAAEVHPYQVILISFAVVFVSMLLNTIIGSLLPKVEGIFLVLHILGYFGILIPLVYYAPKGNASELFSLRMNEGDWPTYGLSFMIGTSGLAFSFVGADCAAHMSEEVGNPAVNVPRAIVSSVVVNGVLGFGMLLAVLFCMGDPQAALGAAETIGYPFIEIFRQATSSVAGSSVMTAILITMAGAATVGFLATGSRMIWSFGRDKGLPFSPFLSRVEPKTTMPLYAVAVASIVPCLLALINFGSSTAFNDVVSLVLNAFYTTYLFSSALLLYNRLGSSIQPSVHPSRATPAVFNEATGEYDLTWGPWHVPGWIGIINNVVACAYLLVIWLFAFFPPSKSVTASTMNYSSLVFGATFLFSVVYYIVRGRHQYNGPVIELST